MHSNGTFCGLSFSRSFRPHAARHVALVVLDDDRQVIERVALLGEVAAQVLHRLEVRFHTRELRIGHEHHAVDALQDQLAAGVVEDLARHRVQVEAGLEAADLTERERKEIEKQSALGLGRKRDHLAARGRVGLAVDVLKVGGLAA